MAKRTARADTKSQPGRLRIVAGIWRSRLLDIADVAGLRPTSERIRETLFNWMAPRIEGCRCLDLFAGTGALAFEALSRGAVKAVLVESSPPAAAVLRESIGKLDAVAEVREMDAFEFVRKAADDAFDIVFLDPPFAAGALAAICNLLAESMLLAESARVYLEEDRGEPPVTLPAGWQIVKTKNAGNVRYSLVETSAHT